jgi:two-component system, NtrC family, response regulator PilR
MPKPAVLVVDDEPDLTELVVLTLSRMSIDTAVAADLASARAQLTARHFDLCLTDMRLPDGDGLDLVSWIQANRPRLPVAVITAHGNVELAVKALKLGAFDFVSKPLDIGGLRKMVNSAVRLAGTNEATGTFVGGPLLIGSSARMQELRDLIGRVARSQAPVHIFGESGTGKELVARLIHNSGPRHDGPFVAVNCGAIPSELMESELFGHKRGSFTGAVADNPGLIRNADGGTLFLDEVAELPLHMQVKLLRVIQEKTVRGIGEAREQTTDVRILSATHKKLAEQVSAGRFREDLYYRINVIEVPVPALREHREDMDELVHAILRRQARKLSMAVPEMTAEAREALRNHPFPGNVRELENVLERALALHGDGDIGIAALQLRQHPGKAAAAATALSDIANATDVPPGTTGEALGERLEHMERDAIVRALEQTRYNKTAAAKLLGMSFRALRYKIQKLGID